MDDSSSSRSRSKSGRRNWADMTIELLGLILDKSVLLADFIRFGSVCKPWGLAAKHAYNSWISLHQALPMLSIVADERSKDYKRLYIIWKDKIYPHSLQIPHQHHKRYYGSGYGWLTFLEKKQSAKDIVGFSVTLLNPCSERRQKRVERYQ